MKKNINLSFSPRTVASGLFLGLTALLVGCTNPIFEREAGALPSTPDGTPVGALYATGSLNPHAEIIAINQDTEVAVIYRLSTPAKDEVTVTLSLGDQADIDRYNDANGLEDKTSQYGGYIRRYQMLPETNFALPTTRTLTIAKGARESAALKVEIFYDETLVPRESGRMRNPWMLPLRVDAVRGAVVPAQTDECFLLGIRPANLPVEEYFADNKQDKLFCIAFIDCRVILPSLINVHALSYGEYLPSSRPGRFTYTPQEYAMLFDVACLRPATISADTKSGIPMLTIDPDLAYVMQEQARYIDPVRDRHTKVCVAVDVAIGSPMGLCNLSNEGRASLAWQIAQFVKTNKLDGVALDDAKADYAAKGAAPVDKASYTRFLKALREALGNDKLILVSYRADANAALYEAHDGLKAGDYISNAWWATANTICDPYAEGAEVKPIIALAARNFGPISAESIDNPQFYQYWTGYEDEEGNYIEPLYSDYKLANPDRCRVNVWLDLPLRTQGFMEFMGRDIPNYFTVGTWSGGSSKEQGPGCDPIIFQQLTNPEWYEGGGYEGGRKDW